MSTSVPITVRVNVASPYNVLVGAGLLQTLGTHVREALPHARRVFVIADDACSHWTQLAITSLKAAQFHVHNTDFAAIEENKTNDTTDYLLLRVARAKLERNDAIIALGGGLIGDVAGFVAATYRRGIAWVQCPTTLLSMVDASVGGKTGVNLLVDDELQKNMVGAFHQPALVLADVLTLATLNDRAFASGCAEIIKHAMIAQSVPKPDATLTLESLQASLPTLRSNPAAIANLVAQNVALKACVVERDERELKSDGGRALLNLGHTFAHAMETIETAQANTQTTPGLQHGEAVALGLIAATHCAAALNLVSPTYCDDVRATITAANLPTRVQGLPSTADLITRMHADKKTIAGTLRIIAPTGKGTAQVITNPPLAALEAGWNAIR